MHYYIFVNFFFFLKICTATNVFVNTSFPVHKVSEKFIGVTLDSSMSFNSNWKRLNFTFMSPLASALGPLYFRFGGTDADSILFMPNSSFDARAIQNTTEIHFTTAQLEELCGFAKNVGWRLIFDLNLLLRNGSAWDSSNPEELIKYADSKIGCDMDFELGNEPDWFKDFFGITLTGTVIADGYKKLRSILNQYDRYKKSIIIGISIGVFNHSNGNVGLDMVTDFLANGGGNAINGLTWHHYYFAGATAKVDDFLNPKIMNDLLPQIRTSKSFNYTPVWLGETSSAYNGGGINMSDRYVAGFLWLDKLGLSALHGIDVVLRQDFWGGNYALLNRELYPNPDYWLTFIYKKLVGTQVYPVSVDVEDPNLRLYAASSKNSNSYVLYGQSMSNKSSTIDLPNLTNKNILVYLLTEGNAGDLLSTTSKLNGQTLEWNPHQPITNMNGNPTVLPLELPPYSLFYIVFGEEKPTKCPQGWYTETTNPSKCIKAINNFTQPWFGARFDCQSYGSTAHLLTIENAFENNEITKLISNAGCQTLFIDYSRNGTIWASSTGSSSNFTNWKSGYPTNNMINNCVVIDTNGTWSNVDCDSLLCYLCEKIV